MPRRETNRLLTFLAAALSSCVKLLTQLPGYSVLHSTFRMATDPLFVSRTARQARAARSPLRAARRSQMGLSDRRIALGLVAGAIFAIVVSVWTSPHEEQTATIVSTVDEMWLIALAEGVPEARRPTVEFVTYTGSTPLAPGPLAVADCTGGFSIKVNADRLADVTKRDLANTMADILVGCAANDPRRVEWLPLFE
jgi:hypothetical protein